MTKSEQRMAMVLGLILIGGGAVLGMKKLKSWKADVDLQAAKIEARKAEADDLLSKQDFWDQRSTWLTEKMPPFTREGEANTQLLTLAEELANKNRVKITGKQPNEKTENAGMTAANIAFEVRGDMKPVLQWLHELQTPANFIVVPSMAITPNEEVAAEIILNMTAQKWFKNPSS
jgi:hypothetical protein